MTVQSRIKVTPLNVHRVIDEHLRILEALHARNAAGTREALALHLDNSLKLALGVTVD
jgi:DNA-binding GntR family transcriptional regulator